MLYLLFPELLIQVCSNVLMPRRNAKRFIKGYLPSGMGVLDNTREQKMKQKLHTPARRRLAAGSSQTNALRRQKHLFPDKSQRRSVLSLALIS